MAPVNIAVATLHDDSAWDAFVRQAPGATFCHLAGWRHVLKEAMHHEPHYLAAVDSGGRIAGVLPLAQVRSRLFGVRYISLPCLNDGGPIGGDDAVAELAKHAFDLAKRANAALELRVRKPLEGFPARSDKVTVVMPLAETPEEVWSRFPSKLRSQVRRPQKAGFTARFGTDQLGAFYQVWSHNMRDLGTPVLPRRFFEAVGAHFSDRLIVGCVYSGNVPVAAAAGFVFNGECEITWASALRAYNRDAPNMMLYWEFMQKAIEAGARTFNFGRCTPGEGTHRFKLQWGGETIPLPWAVNFDAGTSSQPGWIMRTASAAWKRIPVPIANLTGPMLARQLPWW